MSGILIESIWVIVLLVLAGITTWLVYRAWKARRGWIKWPASILSGIATLLILAILVLSLLPIPPNVAPIPTLGHTGAPDNSSTTPLKIGASRTLTVQPGETIQAAIDQAQPGDTVDV